MKSHVHTFANLKPPLARIRSTTCDVWNQTKSLDKALSDFFASAFPPFFIIVHRTTRQALQHQPTNPLMEKSQRRTPFSERRKKNNFMTRDSLSFLMLFLLLSHNPISFYVLRMCGCVRALIAWIRFYDLYRQKFSFPPTFLKMSRKKSSTKIRSR